MLPQHRSRDRLSWKEEREEREQTREKKEERKERRENNTGTIRNRLNDRATRTAHKVQILYYNKHRNSSDHYH